MSYTKGEWYLQEYTDAYTNIVRCNNGKHETLYIASTSQNSSPETRANAKLMAAAPDLLEALQEIIAITDRKHDAWDKAKVAIIKAVGENKPIQWWEERKPEEMPEYVKVISKACIKDTGLFCKVYKWHVYDESWPTIMGNYGAELEGFKPDYLKNTDFNFPGQVYGRVNAIHLIPATREEYETYITQQNG